MRRRCPTRKYFLKPKIVRLSIGRALVRLTRSYRLQKAQLNRTPQSAQGLSHGFPGCQGTERSEVGLGAYGGADCFLSDRRPPPRLAPLGTKRAPAEQNPDRNPANSLTQGPPPHRLRLTDHQLSPQDLRPRIRPIRGLFSFSAVDALNLAPDELGPGNCAPSATDAKWRQAL
jgi:hypothetical protein